MQTPAPRCRRATSDDLTALAELWTIAGLSATEMEPRFTEFQVMQDDDGRLVAALGLRVADREGLLHGECIPDFGQADNVRPILWQRIHQVATNQGLSRIWTQETAPFWRQLEFVAPSGDQMAKLPGVFREAEGSWRVLVLRNEDDLRRLDREFELYLQQERARAEELKSRGRMLYGLAILLALALFVFVLITAFRVLGSRSFRSDMSPAPQPPAATASSAA